MKSPALAAALWTLSASALYLAPRQNSKVVGLDIHRRKVANPYEHDRLRRRSKTVLEALDNLETLYFANASIGTPAQNLRLHIDTGSSDLWVNSYNSKLCRSGGNQCGASGTYNANSSSTYSYLNGLFNISYVDGSGASGDYATDTFRFGGQTIKDMQFGIGYVSKSTEGILGIGYAINEVAVNRAGLQPYANLPQKLVDDGFINTNAYSLWLNDLDASEGSILFGGVDTNKFHGTLQTLPILQENNVYQEFIIALTGMGGNGSTTSLFSNQNVAVLLDSGSSLMYLPDTIVQTLYNTYNVQYDSSQGAAFVDCKLANSQDTLDFSFSGVNISVPMSELVIQLGYSKGQTICGLGIGPAGKSMCVLGDTFLRSAYVVYDLANNKISLAQTNFNSNSQNIEEIQSGTNGVPSATGVANAASTAAVGTSGSRIGGATITGHSANPAAAMPTANPWAGAVVAGAGIIMGMNGF